MAKTPAKASVKETTSKADEYKYTVDDLADYLGIEPASARIKLRNAGTKKAPTGRYGWKTKTSMEELGDELGKKKAAPKKETAKLVKGKAPAKGKSKKASDDD